MKKIIFISVLINVFSYMQLFSQTNWFWQNPLPQGNSLMDVIAFNSDSAIAVGQESTIIKTTNGGIEWNIINGLIGVTGPRGSFNSV
jgi:hypothetical protein